LKILADNGDEAYAQSIVNNLVNTTYDFISDESQLYTARESLANRILNGNGTPLPPINLRSNLKLQ